MKKPYINDAYPMKAQYTQHETIVIAVEMSNPTERDCCLRVEMKINLLNRELEAYMETAELLPFESKRLEVTVAAKNSEFDGFGVDISLYEGEEQLQEFSTSFDVVASWRKATRYGFLSDFAQDEQGKPEDVLYLNKLHLNLIQFYDWMYRHEDLVPPQSDFKDLMGRESSLQVVKEKVTLCHQYGMKAMAYGAVYAASKAFYDVHPDWALYDSNGKVLDFIGLLYYMNISPDSPWHNHIIAQYRKAIAEVDFDGIHMDTYGYPKKASSLLGGVHRIESLKDQFPLLIENTRKELEQQKADIALIFNQVGNWPVQTTAMADQDAVYIEVWHPYERYHHIQQIIAWAKHLGEGKPVILAAYLKPFREMANAADEQTRTDVTDEKANISALLLTAIISANGAYHLLHGEHQAVLTQGYYVDYTQLEDLDFVREMRNYYDFIVRYANVLFNNELEDVSMTHAGGDNLEYTFENITWSAYGEAAKVWTIIRESSRYKAISFINLTNNAEDYWNEGKNRPNILEGINVNMVLDGAVKSVFIASPDREMGRPCDVPYQITVAERGLKLTVTIPKLSIWELLIVELEV